VIAPGKTSPAEIQLPGLAVRHPPQTTHRVPRRKHPVRACRP
jgi:hypothetical protein